MDLRLTFRRYVNDSSLFVWKIFLIAFVLRVAFVLFYPQVSVHGDALEYDQAGWNLAAGTGVATGVSDPRFDLGLVGIDPAVLTPGPLYGVFLAGIYLTFGHDLTSVRIIQAVLSAATILVLFSTVRDVFGPAVARLSGILIAFYPAFIIYPGVLLTETLYLFLLTVLVWVLIRAVQSDSAWGWVLAGTVMGTTILLRKETLAMMPVFVALIWWKFPQRILTLNVSLFLLATALPVGAWTARNYLVFQEFIAVTAKGGDVLWLSTKESHEWSDHAAEVQLLTEGLDPVERDKALRREAIRSILDDPVDYVRVCMTRLPKFWIASHTTYLIGFTDSFRQYYIGRSSGKLFVKIVLLGANTALLILGAWGVLGLIKADKETLGLRLFFLVPVLVKAITHFFLVTESRMQVPIMPFVLVFAAASLYRRGRTAAVRTPQIVAS